MAFGGLDAVDWGHCSGSTCGGVLGIVVSWFMSPALAACFSAALFLFTKHLVLRAADPFRRALCFYPFYIFVTWTVTRLASPGHRGTPVETSTGPSERVKGEPTSQLDQAPGGADRRLFPASQGRACAERVVRHLREGRPGASPRSERRERRFVT